MRWVAACFRSFHPRDSSQSPDKAPVATYVGGNSSQGASMRRHGPRRLVAVTIAASLFALLFALWAFDHIPTLVLVPSGLFRLVAFAMYGFDQAASPPRWSSEEP